jgi:hypothetical protein
MSILQERKRTAEILRRSECQGKRRGH